MKILILLLWVTQFGFSVLFPLCLFLYLGFWLQNRFELDLWVTVLCGTVGFMTSISTAKSCLRSMLKVRDEASSQRQSPNTVKDHRQSQ